VVFVITVGLLYWQPSIVGALGGGRADPGR
jgi:hypothetical protein